MPEGDGLENHLVDDAAGYPRPGHSGLWIFGRCAGLVAGLVVAVSSFVSATRVQNGAHVVPGMLMVFALGVLGLFVAGYAAASLLGKVGRRR